MRVLRPLPSTKGCATFISTYLFTLASWNGLRYIIKRNRTQWIHRAVGYLLISSISLFPPINASALNRSPGLNPQVKADTSIMLLSFSVPSLNFLKVSFCALLSAPSAFFVLVDKHVFSIPADAVFRYYSIG